MVGCVRIASVSTVYWNPASIRHELNLTASAGVAPNKFLAKLASEWKKPDGLFVIQPQEVDFAAASGRTIWSSSPAKTVPGIPLKPTSRCSVQLSLQSGKFNGA